MSELVVRICLGDVSDGIEVRVGALEVPDSHPVADADFRRALSIVLREAADRIDPDLPPAPQGCTHPRLVPRLPCGECDPREPMKARFG